MKKKLSWLTFAALALSSVAQEPPGVSLCTFNVRVRIRVFVGGTPPPVPAIETYVEYLDSGSPYQSREDAQARAQQILALGYQRRYYKGGSGTAVGVSEQWYGPHTISRVEITPIGYGGDPANCIGQ